jgi:hypothetical protein
MTTENTDSTIDEIHRIRREIATKFRGDIFAITADARTRMEASGHQIIRHLKSSHKAMHPSVESQDAPSDESSSTTG